MASGQGSALYRDLDLIAGAGSVAGMGDAELLARFAARADGGGEAAFEAIVRRHGPMVRAVCSGVLRDRGEADDAFQATFLVLVRKAGSVRVADSLGPWLYGVARRVAAKARVVGRRRRGREATGVEAEATARPDDSAATVDVRPIVHEELARLPEAYRAAVVLCHLEGKSHEEAARLLRWPVGTLSGRLSRARDLLRSRLARRGLGVTATTVAAALVPREASSALVRSTAQAAARFAAGGAVPSSILRLTKGALTAMLMHKLRIVGIVAGSVAAVSVGASYVVGQVAGGSAAPGEQKNANTTVVPIPPPGDSTPPAAFPAPTPVDAAAVRADQQRKMLRQMGFTLDPGPIPGVIRSKNYVAVTPPDGRAIRVMSLNSPGIVRKDYNEWWLEYRVPEGVKVMPVGNEDVLALGFSGPEIREIAIYAPGVNNFGGAWMKHPLREPARGQIAPMVGPGWVLYQSGRDIYAFSLQAIHNPNSGTRQWDVLHLDKDGPAKFETDASSILVQQGDTLHVFSVPFGRWSKGVALQAPADAKK